MIYHFLINPAAGRNNVTDALMRKITRVCTARALDYRIHITTRPGDATAYTRAALAEAPREEQRFYACGGDGTLCETVNGAPPFCRTASFGVVPTGTGNDFERNFTGRENFLDIERQIDATAAPVDLIRYNDRYCLNMINIGFDCNVVKKTGEIKRSPVVPAGLAYATGVAITLCKKFGTKMHIELADGTVIHDTLLLTAIANGGFCGGGFHAAPRASLVDGLLDLCAIRRVSRMKFINLVGLYKAGTHLDSDKTKDIIRYYQTPRLRYTFDNPIDICVDGEIEMTDHVDIEAVPGALSFLIPSGSAFLPARAAKESAAEEGAGETADAPEGEGAEEVLPQA